MRAKIAFKASGALMLVASVPAIMYALEVAKGGVALAFAACALAGFVLFCVARTMD